MTLKIINHGRVSCLTIENSYVGWVYIQFTGLISSGWATFRNLGGRRNRTRTSKELHKKRLISSAADTTEKEYTHTAPGCAHKSVFSPCRVDDAAVAAVLGRAGVSRLTSYLRMGDRCRHPQWPQCHLPTDRPPAHTCTV